MATRQRLLECGTRLIADRGYANVTVGEIEEASGLAPRRGGLYKHFASKEALIEEALTERIEIVKTMQGLAQDVADQVTPAVLRSTAAAVLEELDHERDLIRIFEADGSRFASQRDRFATEVVAVGYRHAQLAFEGVCEHHSLDLDARALATVALSALINHRRQQWTLGELENGLDDDAFLDAWTTLVWSAIGPPSGMTTNSHNEPERKA